MNNCIFATAGHIDHGKTALIRILTGVDTDRLEEEKKRGITIDLGYAHLVNDTTTIHFIDVPGHEKFIRNMLAGAGTVNAVLMIIAADESIKPQTKEHFEICRLLGINRGVIALTKKDLVDTEKLDSVVLEIETFAKRGFLEKAKIIPVSSKNGEGIAELKNEIFSIAENFEEPVIGDIFRLPVDRSFSIQGFGTVVTGSLIQGKIRTGESVEVFPSRRKFSVRGIQVFNRSMDFAERGQRTALNIQKAARDDFKRGDILTNTDYFSGSKEIEVVVELLDEYSKVIGKDKFIKFYHLSQERTARLLLLNSNKPSQGEKCSCRLLFDDLVLTLPGDRFILRKLNPVETVGGGVVIFNKAGKRTASEILSQAERLNNNRKSAVLNLIQERGVRCISLKDLRAASGIDTAELNEYTSELRNEGNIIQITPVFLYAVSQIIEPMKEQILSILDNFHRTNPAKTGLSAVEITESVSGKPDPQLVNFILQSLIAEKHLVLDKQYYILPGFKQDFDSRKSDLAAQIENIIKNAEFSPPAIKELSTAIRQPEGMIRKILKELGREKKIIEIDSEIFIHPDILNTAIEELRNKYVKASEVKITDFKTVISSSRKYLIPILEYLDNAGVTFRLPNGNRIIK
jgi:selenocysteine-specific elongation factor